MQRPLSLLHPYQVQAIRFILDRPNAALWLDMGLGKTAVTLCALRDLIDRLEVFGVLIVAPLRVCQAVWRQEAAQWAYTSDLTFTLIHGSAEQRRRQLRKRAMIYLINYENLTWLQREVETVWLSRGQYPPFDTLVLDEISRVKNARLRQGTGSGRAVLKLLPYLSRRIGLTGTPASNGLLDLFGQYLCLDSGQRLGTSFEAFKRKYFYQTDWNGYRFAPFEHSEGAIRDLVSDITISMRNEDYLQLPRLIINDIYVTLPDGIRDKYEKMEKEFLLEFDSGKTLELNTEASKINRCLQVANGACYVEPNTPDWEVLHDAKLRALDDIMEEAAGTPLLLAFQFRHDAYRIQKRYPGTRWINSELSEEEMLQLQDDWNESKVPLLIGHPKSLGHGLNLQIGGSTLVWFGLNWSQELVSQTVARLRRQGQAKPVFVHRILARNTFDVVQRIALEEKRITEQSIRSAIETYRATREKGLSTAQH